MRQILVVLLLAWGGQVAAQNTPAPLSIHQVSPEVFVFTTYSTAGGKAYPANGLYWVTPRGVLLVDTPWDPTQFQPLLDSIWAKHRQKVMLCLASHFHEDRTAGLTFYRNQGIPTYTSAQTKQWCQQRGTPQAEYTFRRDTVFTLGGRHLHTFYPGAGHSADNLVIWFAEAKVLFGGCLVKSTDNLEMGNVSDADLPNWPVAIRRVQKKYGRAKVVVPGHFSWTNRNSLTHTLELLRQAGYGGKK